MGLSIGQIPAAVAGLRSSPEFGQVRLREDSAASGPRITNPEDPAALGFASRGEPVPRAGFGDGTLSPQGAALRTINRTVEEVRRAQPSLAELRARFQARATESRGISQAAATSDRNGIQRVERRIPEASGQVRRFIGGVGAPSVEDTGGRGASSVSPQISGPAANAGGESRASASRPDRIRIDVRV